MGVNTTDKAINSPAVVTGANCRDSVDKIKDAAVITLIGIHFFSSVLYFVSIGKKNRTNKPNDKKKRIVRQ